MRERAGRAEPEDPVSLATWLLRSAALYGRPEASPEPQGQPVS